MTKTYPHLVRPLRRAGGLILLGWLLMGWGAWLLYRSVTGLAQNLRLTARALRAQGVIDAEIAKLRARDRRS